MTASFFDGNNLFSDNKPVPATDSQSILLNYSMIDNILKKVSKSKDKYILKSMAFINPINVEDTDQSDNLDPISEYTKSLCDLVNIISPINFKKLINNIKSVMETLLLGKLPAAYTVFSPIVDVLPVIPVLFLLLAFVWQASVGFR